MKNFRLTLAASAVFAAATAFVAAPIGATGNPAFASYDAPQGNGHIVTAQGAPEGNGHVETAQAAPEGNGHVETAQAAPEGNGHVETAQAAPEGNGNTYVATAADPEGNHGVSTEHRMTA